MIDLKVSSSYKRHIKEVFKYIELFQSDKNVLNRCLHNVLYKYDRILKNCKWSHYLQYNVAKIVSELYANCVLGVGWDFTFQNASSDEEWNAIVDQLWMDMDEMVREYIEENDIEMKLLNAVTEQSYIWYSVLKMYENEMDDLKVWCIPVWYYFPWSEPWVWESIHDIGSHYIITSYIRKDNSKVSELEEFKYIKETWMRNHTIELHKYIAKPDEKVMHPTAYGTNTFLSTIKEETELTFLPLFIFNNDYVCWTNHQSTYTNEMWQTVQDYLYWFGDSDIKPIFDLTMDINNTISSMSLELINNMHSKMSVPSSVVEQMQKNKKKMLARKWIKSGQVYDEHAIPVMDTNVKLFFHKNGEQVAKFIQKDPSFLQEWREHIKFLLQMISSVSGIPLNELLEEWWWQEKVGAIVERKRTFISRCKTKRWLVKPKIRELMYRIAVIQFGWTGGKPQVDFNKMSTDKLTVQEYIQLCNKWLMSKKTTTWRITWMSPDEVEVEFKKINSEKLQTWREVGTFTSWLTEI